MAIDLKTLSVDQLKNLIDNHRRKGVTDTPLYLEALRELGVHKGNGLEFNKSLSIILCAARHRKFLSYKQLAKESQVDFNKVRFAMNGHLWDLVEYSHRKQGILFSAIVVNADNVATGEMDPPTLMGFVGAARALGYPITDDEAFLREQQARVFAWAQKDAPATAQ